jgi:threonyl-tRNA synthetase
VVALTLETYRDFGFNEFVIYVATRPEKAIGEVETWNRATEILKRALAHQGLEYKIKEGEGAFYGPKIEFNVKDSIGRQWQLGTAQVDFFLPQRFGMEYIGPDSQPHAPVMLHRAIFGSLERFIGVLIEHTMGAFPPWLAPLQAIVLPITDEQIDYAKATAARLREMGIRAEADVSSERLQKKIRNAQLMKIPHMLVAGGREAAAGNVAVRLRSGEDLGATPVEEYIAKTRALVAARSFDLWEKPQPTEGENGKG